MANRFGRAQRKTGKTVAQKRRLTILPKADRLWLLAGTAIITGAVMWPTHPALAACIDGGTTLDCVEPNETDPRAFNPTGDFDVNIGEDPDGADGGIQVEATDANDAPALTIDGGDTWG